MTGQQPRANQQGDPCPPWCVTDHTLKFSDVHVGRARGAGHAWACAFRGPAGGDGVAVNGVTAGASAELTLSVRDALQLAALAGMAGDAGELAGALRKAAADITSTQGGTDG